MEAVMKRFVKPTVEEVAAYCKERNNGVDPEAFFDFYESKGWLVGKSPMKNWQAAVRTWERNCFSSPNRQEVKPKSRYVDPNSPEAAEWSPL